MTSTIPGHSTTRAHVHPSGSNTTRALLPFAITAIGIGMPLVALSTVITPQAPFLLASLLFGLALPALFLTHREGGGAAVRALLRDCLRLPSSWWWLPLAAFVLPVATWTAGVSTGGATHLTWGLASFYVQDLIIGALVINIWEEMAWTGFFQRRAAGRWGAVGGALVTSLFFTAIHVPLALDGVHSMGQVATNVALIAGVATGVRLLVARVDVWSGRSLLTIGILHSSFNASETLVNPGYDYLRIVVTIAIGVGLLLMGKPSRPQAQAAQPPAVARPAHPDATQAVAPSAAVVHSQGLSDLEERLSSSRSSHRVLRLVGKGSKPAQSGDHGLVADRRAREVT